MDTVVGATFLRASPAYRRHLLRTVGTYVTHPPFLHVVRQINPDDARGAQITHVCLQLGQFNSNSKLWVQVEEWLTSEKRIETGNGPTLSEK